MIKPTIGRVLWYWDSWAERADPTRQPLPALVTFVHSDHLVNLTVLGYVAGPMEKLCVTLFQDESNESPPAGRFAEWMPYQKGQDAKANAESKEVADSFAESYEQQRLYARRSDIFRALLHANGPKVAAREARELAELAIELANIIGVGL